MSIDHVNVIALGFHFGVTDIVLMVRLAGHFLGGPVGGEVLQLADPGALLHGAFKAFEGAPQLMRVTFGVGELGGAPRGPVNARISHFDGQALQRAVATVGKMALANCAFG